MGELPDQREAEALKLILFDELIKVHAEQLKGHADVVSEGEILQHVDDVHARVLVLLPQVLQDPDLLRRLPVEALLVADHLQGHVGLSFVVEGLHHLSEAALANDFEDFVAVCNVVMWDMDVGSLIIIIATVVGSAQNP